MNSELHQYPAALYSAVSEIGYRRERFTGEVLRSGSGNQRSNHRRPRLSRLRLSLVRGWFSQPRQRREPARPAAEAPAAIGAMTVWHETCENGVRSQRGEVAGTLPNRA
jgi:hypothetical protein